MKSNTNSGGAGQVQLIRDLGVHGWGFHCPGCKCGHAFAKDGRWTFNGNMARPTFSPSLVVRGAAVENHVHGASKFHGRCHLFVRDGMIQFLGDCAHELAGKTVPVEPL